jgi:chromosome segregation ATPase
MRATIISGFERLDQSVEHLRQRVEKVDAESSAIKSEVLKLRADVADGTAAVKEVAVRLTLIEQRLKSVEPA